MGMQHDIELPTGVTVRYHRILRMDADFKTLAGKAYVKMEIGCYLDKAARDAGKEPVLIEHRTMTVEAHEPTRQLAYIALSQPVQKTIIKKPGQVVDGAPQLVDVEIDDPNTVTGFNGAEGA